MPRLLEGMLEATALGSGAWQVRPGGIDAAVVVAIGAGGADR